jgi:chromosome segregation ATPase
MESKNTHNIIPVPVQTSVIEKSSQIPFDSMKAEVMMALNTLDSIYKENIKSYADSLHDCTRQIEDAQHQLEQLYKEIKPHTSTLTDIEKELDYELRTLERFTTEWTEVTLVINALTEELSQLNHSEVERNEVLKSRNDTLKKLQNDIDNTEIKLLEHALQKQNITLIIEPTEREISALELRIKKLKSKKQYIEASHLHQLSPQGEVNKAKQLENNSDIIDV